MMTSWNHDKLKSLPFRLGIVSDHYTPNVQCSLMKIKVITSVCLFVTMIELTSCSKCLIYPLITMYYESSCMFRLSQIFFSCFFLFLCCVSTLLVDLPEVSFLKNLTLCRWHWHNLPLTIILSPLPESPFHLVSDLSWLPHFSYTFLPSLLVKWFPGHPCVTV